MVGRAGGAVVEAASHADDPHGQAVEHGTVPDELVRAQRSEGDDRVDVGDEARLGQPGGQAHHVLLGHARVEEAGGVTLGEGLEHGVTEVAGEEDDPRIAIGQLGHRPREGRPHFRVSSSLSA